MCFENKSNKYTLNIDTFECRTNRKVLNTLRGNTLLANNKNYLLKIPIVIVHCFQKVVLVFVSVALFRMKTFPEFEYKAFREILIAGRTLLFLRKQVSPHKLTDSCSNSDYYQLEW